MKINIHKCCNVYITLSLEIGKVVTNMVTNVFFTSHKKEGSALEMQGIECRLQKWLQSGYTETKITRKKQNFEKVL